MHTGMTDEQMEEDLKEKETVLQWMLDNNVRTVNSVGKVVAEYYHDRDKVMKVVKSKGKPKEIIGDIAKELETAVWYDTICSVSDEEGYKGIKGF